MAFNTPLWTWLLSLAALGGLVGWLGGSELAWIAVAVCSVIWGAWLRWQLGRSLAQARAAQWANGRSLGLSGELFERFHKALRHESARAESAHAQLDDLRAALQASPNGVLLLDARGQIEWFNQTAAGLFGLERERDEGQWIGNLVREPAWAQLWQQRTPAAQQGPQALQAQLHGRAHSPGHPVLLKAQLHAYGDGRWLLLATDVTAQQQAEAMRRDFVANVSHEIRTPLTVLAGFVETLQTLSLSETEKNHYLDLMAQQAQRMQTLVHDLLTLSRLEGSPAPALDQWVDFKSLFRQVQTDAQALSALLGHAAQPVHHLAFSCDTGDVELAGSATELFSALSNLVSNALRYTAAGGHVHVQAQRKASGVLEFAVIDTGVGIAPEHISRLTERFYRVDRSRSRETGGTGLGLAIVKHVAQRHAARLDISSVLGQGSRFELVFAAQRVRDAQSLASIAPQTIP